MKVASGRNFESLGLTKSVEKCPAYFAVYACHVVAVDEVEADHADDRFAFAEPSLCEICISEMRQYDGALHLWQVVSAQVGQNVDSTVEVITLQIESSKLQLQLQRQSIQFSSLNGPSSDEKFLGSFGVSTFNEHPTQHFTQVHNL